MAFKITYKLLFEIRIIHSFYVNDDAYYLNDENARLSHLEEIQYNLINQLSITPIANCQELLNGHHIVFKPTPIGFKAWIEVREEEEGEYYPIIAINKGTNFLFGISIENPYLVNFSNFRFKPNVDAVFYFNNFQNIEDKTYPSLALSPLLLKIRKYEMGEMMIDASSNVFISNKAIEVTDPSLFDPVDWDMLNPIRQHINYNDRMLVKGKFYYHFSPNVSTTIDDAIFVLYDESNVKVKSIDLTGITNLSEYLLDFSDVSNGFYKLEINGSNPVYKDVKMIHINKELPTNSLWGVIDIKYDDGLGDFNLHKDGPKEYLLHPVFEIRVLNRATYWKFIGKEDQVFTPTSNVDVENFKDDNGDPISHQLVTKSPIPVSASFQEVLYREDDPLTTDQNEEVQLPNPSAPYIHSIKRDKVFSEVYLPKIKP